MYKIRIRRVCELKAPFDLCAQNANDWTHFAHLHRKSHLGYRLLQKRPGRELFLYTARLLYPLPFSKTYLVFREQVPSQAGYRALYLDVRSGRTHYLNASVVAAGGVTRDIGEYVFCLPDYWRLFPRLFLWLFRRRMGAVRKEDNAWIEARMAPDAPRENPACAPSMPEEYDVLKDAFNDASLARADVHWEDHWHNELNRV